MFHDDGADLDRTAVQELATDILPQVKAAYHAAVYPGRMHLFRCAEDTVLWRRMPELGWRDLVAGGIEIHDIPATHQYLMVAPAVGVLARELAACLAACPPS